MTGLLEMHVGDKGSHSLHYGCSATLKERTERTLEENNYRMEKRAQIMI